MLHYKEAYHGPGIKRQKTPESLRRLRCGSSRDAAAARFNLKSQPS